MRQFWSLDSNGAETGLGVPAAPNVSAGYTMRRIRLRAAPAAARERRCGCGSTAAETTQLHSLKTWVPLVNMPDRIGIAFTESGWDVRPVKPYMSAPHVFLADGRAIGYAGTVMGIVEYYKLRGIVGGPTAGANGNVNPFRVPRGYTVSWTGMKVRKHDGSPHHGIGILPAVPVSRTRKGVAEGKDEILVRGVEVVKSKR